MSGSARRAFIGDDLEVSSDSVSWVMIMRLSARYAMHLFAYELRFEFFVP